MTCKAKAQATILIVEDDRMTAELIAQMLGHEGYSTLAASNGVGGINLVKACPPDLILLDIGLPDKNGIDTCRELRSDPAFQTIPVIFVTADTDDNTLAAAFDAGGSDYVRKPVNRIELSARVSCALTRQLVLKKLAEEQKLEAVLETAGGVCHKLNQPLQYILGSLQILLMDVKPDDSMRKTLEAILERVELMGEITGNLANLTHYRTRTHAGGLNILDIDQCLKKNSSSD